MEASSAAPTQSEVVVDKQGDPAGDRFTAFAVLGGAALLYAPYIYVIYKLLQLIT